MLNKISHFDQPHYDHQPANTSMNHIIRPLTTLDELEALATVFTAAFEESYSHDSTWQQGMLDNQSIWIIGAEADNRIIGGAVGFVLTPLRGERELYLYDIAVHPDHQRQGIGVALMTYLKETARKQNIATIFVEAESEDTGAVAFYRSLGGEELAVNHFNFNI